MIENVKTPILIKFKNDFMKMESAPGILLFIATIIAMLMANHSLLAHTYHEILEMTVAVQFGDFKLEKHLLHWINDGLMAIFFFLIGLEIKREIMEGELSSPSQIILPAIGALGGIVVPALIYVGFNYGDDIAMKGWAIPVATDIAFALSVISVFGKRVPVSLKVFLLTLAIFDDLVAIIIIALFYTSNLSMDHLILSGAILCFAILINKLKVTKSFWYILLGIVLWVAVLKSGVHATLAGVAIAFCVPMYNKEGQSPLKQLEHSLHYPVMFAIMPLFAFANAGLTLSGMSLDIFTHHITLGIILGLLVGKPVGILLFVGVSVLLGFVKLPNKVTWAQMLAISFACGIGFTMSLFISGLAFHTGNHLGDFNGDRLGILLGSILSAVFAFGTLHLFLPKVEEEEAVTST